MKGAVGSHGHHLSRVENEADIVEGRRDKTARGDVAFAVLELEGGLERQAGKEGTNGRDQEFELGWEGVIEVVLVRDWGCQGGLAGNEMDGRLTVVIDHDFHVAEDFAVPPMGLLAGLGYAAQALPVVGAVGLGVEHKRHGQQALDPFCDILSAMFDHRDGEGHSWLGQMLPMNWSRR